MKFCRINVQRDPGFDAEIRDSDGWAGRAVYGFEGLTASEAGYLSRFPLPDTIRDRILAAAGEGGFSLHSGDTGQGGSGRSGTVEGGLAPDPAEKSRFSPKRNDEAPEQSGASAFMDADREIEQRFANKLNKNYAASLKAYNALNNRELGLSSERGTALSTDLARELAPDYRKDRSRSAQVHEPASAFIKRLYADKLARPTPPGKMAEVLFAVGGPGAGVDSGLDIPRLASHAKQAQYAR